MTRRFLAAVLLLLAFAVVGNAQSTTQYVRDGQRVSVRHLPDPDAVIIELAVAPLLLRGGASPAAASELNTLLDRLERDVAAMQGLRISAKGTTRVLRHRYTRAFAGASARVSPDAIDRIRNLSYVRAVHPDRVQTALLHESVAQVGAPDVWENHGARGEGVVVAVIDTGIDYMHPSLGGGFGTGFKVRGGRDFVNDDSDPMDDHGHGTHVSGIVAANGGGLTGVAPDATLLAYKSLDSSGSGVDSWVIAAIEDIAVQRPHIVNMSLGRPAVPDDPVVRALENVAASGVVFCVAAGNGGVFLDIGSPANAPSAITVGAINRNGTLASFSSKGPVVPDGSIKPEVVAPGVGIVSALNGGGTRSASGTSMATPHVAGVAALLRDVHPEWSAATLRSALINSARPVDDEVMAVGAGSVHAADALRSMVQASANTLSFGISDQTQNPWIASRTITITNPTDVAQSLSLTIDGLRDGIDLIPSATSISLEPGASTGITFELHLDHTKIPAPAFGSLSFGGMIRIAGEAPSIAIPWSFVKASRVRVSWRGPENATVKLATEHMLVRGQTTNDTPWVDLFIGAGASSLWAEASTPGAVYHVIRDDIDFATTPHVAIGPSDAPHEIRFAGADVEGRLLSDRPHGSNRQMLVSHRFFANNFFESFIYVPSDVQFFVSPLPAATRLIAFEAAFDADPLVTWTAQYPPLEGVDGDIDLTIAPENWQALSARAVMPEDLPDPYQSVFAASWVFAGRSTGMSISRPRTDPPPILGETTIEAWITSPVSNDSGTGILIDIGESGIFPDLGIPLANPELVARFAAAEDGIVAGHERVPRISSKVIGSHEPIVIGEGPAHPSMTIGVRLETMLATVQWSGPHGEDRVYDAKRMQARLYDASGHLIATGEPPVTIPGFPIGPMPGFQMMTALPEPGAYTLEASTSSFRVAGLPARGTLRATFDSAKNDPAPPVLTSLRIDDGSERTSAMILHRSVATVTFSVADFSMMGFGDIRRDRTVVEYRRHADENDWTSITPVVIGEDFRSDGVLYRANLSEMNVTTDGPIDLRISVEDAEGNSMSYLVEPAFVIAPAKRRAVGRR